MVTRASQLFSRAVENSEDEEQLLKLFWNRAELKKELDGLRNEVYRLATQLKQEEAVKLRVQQRLQQLESLLANSATAATAVTYFQLREVWHRCQARLASISAELSKAHHDKEYRQHVAGFQRKLYASLSGMQRELSDVTQAGDMLSNQIRALRDQRSNRLGFWNFFRRRKLTAEINVKRARSKSVSRRMDELTEQIQSRSSIEPPEFAGLDVKAKRSINLTVIAYAQELYLHYEDQELAIKAREAIVRQVSDVRYGDKRDCRALSRFIEDRIKLFEADTNGQSRVQIRMHHLIGQTNYRSDGDTVPVAETLETIMLLKPDGKVRGELRVNVLADEYWDIFAALLI